MTSTTHDLADDLTVATGAFLVAAGPGLVSACSIGAIAAGRLEAIVALALMPGLIGFMVLVERTPLREVLGSLAPRWALASWSIGVVAGSLAVAVVRFFGS